MYLNAKLRSFGHFPLTFLRTWKFALQLAAGLGYCDAYLPRLQTCFSETFPFLLLYLYEIDHVPLACIHVCRDGHDLDLQDHIFCRILILKIKITVQRKSRLV